MAFSRTGTSRANAHCHYDRARGDQCDKCGKWLEPSELIRPKSKIDGTSPNSGKPTTGTCPWAVSRRSGGGGSTRSPGRTMSSTAWAGTRKGWATVRSRATCTGAFRCRCRMPGGRFSMSGSTRPSATSPRHLNGRSVSATRTGGNGTGAIRRRSWSISSAKTTWFSTPSFSR
ncbi:MAG: class I tRNA ligase family protein [Ignavibacteriales bacterium]|nr:class I tRNA ligase family protein [Ignavibacteriales bacterium]